MALTPLLLVLLSGLFHATWNYLTKKSTRKMVFLWWALVFDCVLFFPFVVAEAAGPGFAPGAIRLALFSGALQAAYVALLGFGYGRFDLSFLYPLSRGLVPVLLLIADRYGRGTPFTAAGVTGALLVTVGAYVIYFRFARPADLLTPFRRADRVATLVLAAIGLVGTGYHLIDKAGVGRTSPFAYFFLVSFFDLLFFTAGLGASRRRRFAREAAAEWRENRGAVVRASLAGVLAYPLVLVAMRTSPVGYVGALRNVGILFGVLYGVIALKEPLGTARIVSALAILAGVVLLAAA